MQDSWWWLRSTFDYSRYAAYVDNDGSINVDGDLINYAGNAVRPAVWLTLDG
ncbi:MAG: hypothetical protein IKN72_04310 [Clostridia bacterium]|nr:hypothetical protein [Clostridia bacterium]